MLTLRRGCGDGVAEIVVTERSDGDCAPLDGPRADALTVLRQVHGTKVVHVEHRGDHRGVDADAAWTSAPDAVLAVRTADCVPIALYGTDASGRSAVAVMHAGWRGLIDGVIGATLAELKRHGVSRLRAVIGPHICALHYEFGTDDLDTAAAALGDSVVATTQWGTPALDLAEAVRLELGRGGAVIDTELGRCTASDDRYYSHRAHGDVGRTAIMVRLRRELGDE